MYFSDSFALHGKQNCRFDYKKASLNKPGKAWMTGGDSVWINCARSSKAVWTKLEREL